MAQWRITDLANGFLRIDYIPRQKPYDIPKDTISVTKNVSKGLLVLNIEKRGDRADVPSLFQIPVQDILEPLNSGVAWTVADLDILITTILGYLSTGTATQDVNISQVGGTATAVDDSAMAATPPFIPVGGEYRASPVTYTDGDATVLQTNAEGELRVAMASDIEIGAVELKNAATDDRALISDANTARAATDHVLSVQQIAADGSVPFSGNTVGTAPYSQITDGTDTWSIDGSGFGQVDIAAQSLTAVAVSADAAANLVTNPLFTQITDGTTGVSVLARTTGTEQPAVTDDALIVYDVGGGAASVSSEYRATTAGKGDGTAVYASGTTLTIAATPFTIENEDLVYIREVDATANTANIWVNGTGGVHMEISGGTLTRSGGSDFSANGVYEVGYNGQDKAYDASASAQKALIQNPNPNHERTTTLADTVTLNTTQYYHYYFSGSTYHYFYLRLRVIIGVGNVTPSAGTLKIWASNKTSPTFPTTGAPAAADWQDVSNDVLSAASVTYVDGTTYDVPYFVDSPMRPLWWLVSLSYTDDGDGATTDGTIYAAVTQSY